MAEEKAFARNKEMGNVCQKERENKLLAFYTTMKSTKIYYPFSFSLIHFSVLSHPLLPLKNNRKSHVKLKENDLGGEH